MRIEIQEYRVIGGKWSFVLRMFRIREIAFRLLVPKNKANIKR